MTQSRREFDAGGVLRQGVKKFMELEFLVEAGVLVPRAETELLAHTAIGILNDLALGRNHGDNEPLHVVDMCCGAGNLACSIARYAPFTKVWASDLTESAVNLARRNALHLKVDDSVHVFQGDLFSPLTCKGLEGLVDVIVCNPPYISSGKLEKEHSTLLENEPRTAFDGGPYGIQIQQRLSNEAPSWLKSGGWLLFEIGLGQKRQAEIILRRASVYKEIRFVHDELGDARVAVAKT